MPWASEELGLTVHRYSFDLPTTLRICALIDELVVSADWEVLRRAESADGAKHGAYFRWVEWVKHQLFAPQPCSFG